MFKDKNYKQLSSNLISSSSSQHLKQIKLTCIQMLAFVSSKSVCPQWRTNLISRCVRDEADLDVRKCALAYLPYLIYSLGVSANSLVFQLIHPAILEEKTPEVLPAYANMLATLCCLISRKCVLVRKSYFDCFTIESPHDYRYIFKVILHVLLISGNVLIAGNFNTV